MGATASRSTTDASLTDRSAARARLAAGRDRFVDGLDEVRDAADYQQWLADLYAAQQFDRVDAALGLGDRLGEDTRTYAAIEATFVRLVSAAVTLIVGIFVFAEVSGTMPTPENNKLANATQNVKSTTGSAFNLGAVALIVLVAALILALVGGFGSGSGGRGR